MLRLAAAAIGFGTGLAAAGLGAAGAAAGARFGAGCVWHQAGAEKTIEIASEIDVVRIAPRMPAFRPRTKARLDGGIGTDSPAPIYCAGYGLRMSTETLPCGTKLLLRISNCVGPIFFTPSPQNEI